MTALSKHQKACVFAEENLLLAELTFPLVTMSCPSTPTL